MARYQLVIEFDDTHDEGVEAAALHATLIAMEADKRGFVVESSTFTDLQAEAPAWFGSVDWLEWCQRDEAQKEDA